MQKSTKCNLKHKLPKRNKFPIFKFSLDGFFSRFRPAIKEQQVVAKNQETEVKTTAKVNSGKIYRSEVNHQQATYKIFKPKTPDLIKEKIQQAIPNNSQNKKFTFGVKNLQFLSRGSNLFSLDEVGKRFKWLFVRWDILANFNRFMTWLLVLASVGFLSYLSFFDTYFLVKDYKITFTEGSYLDDAQVQAMTRAFRQEKILGVFPNNQYWFLNQQSLTQISRQVSTEIESVQVLNRQWPNKAELLVTTRPILVTLQTLENNQTKYWRIAQSGKVVAQDTLGLQENLVTVRQAITFDTPGATLRLYPLERNPEQVNRLWFIIWLWQVLETNNISVVSTQIPSLIDSDVIITTTKNTRLFFNSNSLTPDNQAIRMEKFFETQLFIDKETAGQISYVDFRIPRKIFLCEKGKECDG